MLKGELIMLEEIFFREIIFREDKLIGPHATGNQPSVETFAANVERKRIAPRNPCIFCKGDHFNDECESFKSLTERK